MNRFGIPNLGIGVGLRTSHYRYILSQEPDVGWFEIISENYMDTEGRPLVVLDRIAERYPIVMHGVSLSIGSTDPIDWDYLQKLKALKDRVRAVWVSDHFCWTGVLGRNAHDLLPIPYTEEAQKHVVERIKVVQDFLEIPLILENPSTYVEFTASTMPEWEFIACVLEDADAGLLLDINNVYVSGFNHGFDPAEYLRGIPSDRVVQIHLAGHTHCGTHLIDTHIGPVSDPVWELFREAYAKLDGAATLLEWDAEIPTFEVVLSEARKAEAFMPKARAS